MALVVTALLIACGGLGQLLVSKHGFPARYPARIAAIFNFAFEPVKGGVASLGCFDDPSVKTAVENFTVQQVEDQLNARHCLDIADPKKPVIIGIGDSHSGHLHQGLAEVFGSSANFLQLGTIYCVPAVEHVTLYDGKAARKSCQTINTVLFAKIAELKPEFVIIGAYHAQYLSDPQWQYSDYIAQVLAGTKRLHELGAKHVIVVGQVPTWNQPVPALVARAQMAGTDISPYSNDGLNSTSLAADKIMNALVWPEGVTYVSVIQGVCNAQGCMRRVGDNLPDDVMATDTGHLSRNGSIYVVQNIIGPVIRAAQALTAQQESTSK